MGVSFRATQNNLNYNQKKMENVKTAHIEVAAIHRDFHAVLGNYIAKRVNNRADAEDLLQEVFIKVHNNRMTIGSRESIKSWLFTITRNTIIDYYRKKGRDPLTGVEKQMQEIGSEAFDAGTTVELDGCIRRFIAGLPDAYRDIVMDAELKGISQKDLAVKYGIAYPSLRSRVQRGRARLREMFLDCCAIEHDSRGNILDAVPRKGKC
jgi:RNA polymerase sigma-70 factor, ECF subfamily